MRRTRNIQDKWFKRIWAIGRKYYKLNGIVYKVTTYRNGGHAYKVYERKQADGFMPFHRSPEWEITD